jgi:hypothetical protein
MQIAFIFISSSLLPFGIHKPRPHSAVQSGPRFRHNRTETGLPWPILALRPADQGTAPSFRHAVPPRWSSWAAHASLYGPMEERPPASGLELVAAPAQLQAASAITLKVTREILGACCGPKERNRGEGMEGKLGRSALVPLGHRVGGRTAIFTMRPIGASVNGNRALGLAASSKAAISSQLTA